MLGNVLKMASENKITAKNTWSLQLIDHLSDLVKSGEEQTNFQRASCTLDAVRNRTQVPVSAPVIGTLCCGVATLKSDTGRALARHLLRSQESLFALDVVQSAKGLRRT